MKSDNCRHKRLRQYCAKCMTPEDRYRLSKECALESGVSEEVAEKRAQNAKRYAEHQPLLSLLDRVLKDFQRMEKKVKETFPIGSIWSLNGERLTMTNFYAHDPWVLYLTKADGSTCIVPTMSMLIVAEPIAASAAAMAVAPLAG